MRSLTVWIIKTKRMVKAMVDPTKIEVLKVFKVSKLFKSKMQVKFESSPMYP
jgi:hypothetical protein